MKALRFVLGFALSLFRAYVITLMWGWFVVPAFNAPVLSLPLVLGLTCLLDFFRFNATAFVAEYDRVEALGDDYKELLEWRALVVRAIMTVMGLAVSYVVYQFV